MKLYFVSSNPELEERDLFVWAGYPAEAIILWSQHWIGDQNFIDQFAENARVFEVSTKQPVEPMALDWHKHIRKVAP